MTRAGRIPTESASSSGIFLAGRTQGRDFLHFPRQCPSRCPISEPGPNDHHAPPMIPPFWHRWDNGRPWPGRLTPGPIRLELQDSGAMDGGKKT